LRYKKKSSYLSDEEILPAFILNDQDFDFFLKRALVACDEKEVIKKYKIY